MNILFYLLTCYLLIGLVYGVKIYYDCRPARDAKFIGIVLGLIWLPWMIMSYIDNEFRK